MPSDLITVKREVMSKMAKPGTEKEPVQLDFFDKAYKRISSKETERSLQGVVRECIRLGASKLTINAIVRDLGIDNEAVKDAAKALDSKK